MRLFGTVTSNVASMIIGATLIGGVGYASAANDGGASVPVVASPSPEFATIGEPPVQPTASGGTYVNPFEGTVCAAAPGMSPAPKFSVYQDLNYGYDGSNDRLRIGAKSQSWQNDAFDPSVNPYEDFIRLETRGGNSTRLTSVWACMVTTRQVPTGELDPIYGYPLYETIVDASEWINVVTWTRNAPRKVDVTRPLSSYQTLPDGTFQSSYMIAMYVTGKGNGTSTPSYVGGGCCYYGK